MIAAITEDKKVEEVELPKGDDTKVGTDAPPMS